MQQNMLCTLCVPFMLLKFCHEVHWVQKRQMVIAVAIHTEHNLQPFDYLHVNVGWAHHQHREHSRGDGHGSPVRLCCHQVGPEGLEPELL